MIIIQHDGDGVCYRRKELGFQQQLQTELQTAEERRQNFDDSDISDMEDWEISSISSVS